jgi:hypothetical protein
MADLNPDQEETDVERRRRLQLKAQRRRCSSEDSLDREHRRRQTAELAM